MTSLEHLHFFVWAQRLELLSCEAALLLVLALLDDTDFLGDRNRSGLGIASDHHDADAGCLA